MSLKYRPEIDGLRAIAVLSVILFHLQVVGFAGGFIGVDVFFVISGYLISAIIHKEYQTDDFSLIRFYQRRAKRILPVALVVGIFVLILSYYIFEKELYITTNHTLKRSLLFISNFLLLKKQSYFNNAIETNPLLHTWSLSVEEQFYLFYPLVLFFLMNFFSVKKIGYWLFLLAALSFVACFVLVYKYPKEVFYWPYTRAWEFLAGALIVFFPKNNTSARIGNLLSFCGLFLVVVSVEIYHKSLLYPGVYAILPVAGALLIIVYAIPETILYRIITLQPVIYTGKISYSLYMWHWPIWVFSKYMFINEHHLWFRVSFLLLVYLISALSYEYIEKPFRNRIKYKSSIIVSGLLLFACCTYIVTSLIQNNNGGFASKEITCYNETVKMQDTIWSKMQDHEKISSKPDNNNIKPFRIGDTSKKSTVLLWGDSHARSIATGLAILSFQQHIAIDVFTQSSCPPLLGVKFIVNEEKRFSFNENVKHYIEKHPEIRTVVLTARWNNYYNLLNTNATIKLDDVNEPLFTQLNNQHKVFKHGLATTIKWLKHHHIKVIITSPIPELKCTIPEMLTIQKLFSTKNDDFELSAKEFSHEYKSVLSVLKETAKEHNAMVFDASKGLLGPDSQYLFFRNDGQPLYRDNNHLSGFGAAMSSIDLVNYLR